MKTNEIIIYNILRRLDEIDNNKDFKSNYPDISAIEYLYAKVYPNIKLKRLMNILNCKAKRISAFELKYIAQALNIEISKLVKLKT